MEYILIKREGDAKIIADYENNLESYTLVELVEAYNKETKCGIVGVHRQALFLYALKQEFKKRLKESPISVVDHILSMVGPVKIVDGDVVINNEI